jgi:hypothetical protein
VNQGIGPVEESERVLMAMHEPLLHTALVNWEQKAQPAKLFKLQHCNTVSLGNVPYSRFREYTLRGDGGHAVESVVDDPVEHLYQKGELLEYATVKVVLESGGVWC